MMELARAWAALLVSLSMLLGGWSYTAPHADPEGTLILVNKQFKAPSQPPALVLPDIPPSKPSVAENLYLREVAARAIEQLFAAAMQEQEYALYGVSGYRSYATQEAIYKRRVKASGDSAKKWVAPPGHSEHHTGLAMDITGGSLRSKDLSSSFGDTPEGIWVAENGHRFGFIIRYQKGWEKKTGYAYEPWHIRYVGIEHATAMYEMQITLEEYLVLLQEERIAPFLPAPEAP